MKEADLDRLRKADAELLVTVEKIVTGEEGMSNHKIDLAALRSLCDEATSRFVRARDAALAKLAEVEAQSAALREDIKCHVANLHGRDDDCHEAERERDEALATLAVAETALHRISITGDGRKCRQMADAALARLDEVRKEMK